MGIRFAGRHTEAQRHHSGIEIHRRSVLGSKNDQNFGDRGIIPANMWKFGASDHFRKFSNADLGFLIPRKAGSSIKTTAFGEFDMITLLTASVEDLGAGRVVMIPIGDLRTDQSRKVGKNGKED